MTSGLSVCPAVLMETAVQGLSKKAPERPNGLSPRVMGCVHWGGAGVKNVPDFCQKRKSMSVPMVLHVPRFPAEPPGKSEALQPTLLSG